MTVHISQDEMNILNLNGISVEDAKANVDYLRATGLNDDEIRDQFSNTINELRPLTKQSANDTGNIQTWKDKGPITPFEEGKRKSVKFDGTYSNIDEYANLGLSPEQKQKRIDAQEKREFADKEAEQKKLERNKRVNNGTASFWDRAGAFMDRVTDNQMQAAMDSPDDLTIQMSGINNPSKIDKSQKIGFHESLANSYASGAWIPFAGGWITGSEDKKQRDIIERIRNGEAIRPDELNYINHKIQQKQEENVRGYSLGGNIAKDFLPSLIRFGTEMGVGGWALKGLGLGVKATEGASLGQKTLTGLGDMLQTGIANTVLPTGWDNINETYQSRMLDNTFKLTDKGESIFQESEEKPATALYKSIGQTFIMFASEASGGLLKLPIQGAGAAASKYIGSPIAKYLTSNKQLVNLYKKSVPAFSKLYEKINKLPIKGENVDWLKSKVRYDGFLEELGEEVVEDVLNLTIGTDNQERSLENYAKTIFKSPDEWAVLAGAIALQGGTLSAASHILGNHMERNGATDEEIIETLNNLSENDKEKAVENLIQNGEINVDSTSEERIENNINNLAESLLDTGKYSNREQAEKVARLGVNMLGSIADKTGIDIEELINEDMPNIEQDNEATYVDDNGVLHSGVSYNEQEQTLNDRYNDLVDKLNNLPDDYSDEEHLNKMITETDLLEKIQSGEKLLLDDMESVNDLIEEYETNGNNNLANQLRQKLDNTNVDFGNTVVTQRAVNNDNPVVVQRGKNETQHFQRATTAGATTKDEKLNAIREWKEKGTDSKYFKKWFGNSKVVDKNGKPLVVYHGSLWKFDTFGKSDEFDFSFSPKFAYEYAAQKSFEQALDLSPVLYSVYLKAENPFDFRDEKSVNELLKKIGDKEISFWGDKYSHEQFKDLIMGLSYENTVKNQEVFDKAEVGMAYSRYNEDVEEKMSSVADAKIVYKNKDYFVALDEIDEPRRSPFSSEPAGRVDRDDVYKQVEKLAKDIDFADEYIKKITLNTNLVKTTYEVGKGYVDEYTPYELTVRLRKVDNPKIAKKGTGYDNWSFFEAAKIGDTYFLDFLKENGYDSYYKQEKEQLNISVFNPEQIKSVDNRGTFDENNPNIYFQRANRDNINSNIEENFNDTTENITSYIKDDIQNILEENNVDESEFKLEDIKIYGSYSTSTNKKGSDLDFLVQYSGTMKEDVAFNMFADNNLSITDKNGNDVKVDLNPINSSLSGTIDEHLNYYDNLDPAAKTYFQRATSNNNNVVDLTNDFEKAPSIDEVKAYINEIVENGTKFATLSPNWFVDIKGGAKKKAHIIKSSDFSKMNKSQKNRHNKYIMSLEKLLANAEYAGEKENTKKDKKPNVEKYHYFKTDVKIGNKIYQLIFDTEEYKNSPQIVQHDNRVLNPQSEDNNIINDNVKKFNGDTENSKSSLSANVLRSVKNLNEDTNSINDNAENINPKTVHLYNIKEIKNPKMYFQSAYHGSPHKFDEFSLDAIGTGEGNQAHGWGLYFANDKGISEDYRKTLSDRILTYKGKKIPENELFFYNSLYENGKDTMLGIFKYRVDQAKLMLKKIEADREYFGKNYKKDDFKRIQKELKIHEKTYKDVKKIDVNQIKLKEGGQLYKVDIPEIDEMLDEEEPLSVQSDKVLGSIKKLYSDLLNIKDFSNINLDKEIAKLNQNKKERDELVAKGNKTSEEHKRLYDLWKEEEKYQLLLDLRYDDTVAKDFYRHLAHYISDNSDKHKQASLLLNKYGIKGITYDGRQDGRCYVVFDDKAIQVLKKYYQKQRKMFIDNDRADEIANRLVQVKGSFIPAENLVKLFKDADESTIVHEFAHWWLEKLVKHSEGNEELQEDLKEIRKFVKNNGEEFTDEQHERFARGFEAYMRTGSAKTNRLKKLFEDFKNALLSLYDSIKSLGFEESEIPEINNLFDRLLTTENQRIQAAVFDRCNTIQSQIEEIRTNQEKELSEIDEIEKNNLERNLQDTRKKQQVEEYLNLADKASSRVPKSVKDYSKRCRQACYEILSAALNHKYSIKYLQMTLAQNNTKAENLRQELSEVDDDITALGGMQANWYEFFGDTGVNYDTDETDGDAKLVEQALDRIDSNNFTPPESYPGEELIGKFMGAFDYLSGKVLSLRGANKDAAFEALSELFSGRKFGNLIELNRLPQDVMNEISVRMDEISKTYIEQKTNEKNKYAIPNVSLSTQLRTYVSHKLHDTKSYDPIEKRYIRLSSVNKLFSLIPLVNNSLTAKEVVRTINAHAIKQLENRQKYILHKEIQKQVKINSKLIKVGALKQGKFDWKTNTVFSELQQMNRLKKEDARAEYLRLIDADSAVIGEERDNINQDATNDIKAPTDFQGILKVKFLEYKSNDPKNLNLSATRSLLEDILQLKFEGRRAKNEQDLKKALTRYDYKNNLIEIMDKHRNNKIAKYLARWTAGDTIWTSEGTLANWESLLTGIFDKATAEKYSLLKSESDVEVYAHKKALGFYKKAMDIYHLNRSTEGLGNKIRNVWDRALDFDNIQPLVDLFRKYDETNYPFKQVTWNKDTGEFVETTIELNHSQLITLYAWSLNPELKKRLVTQFVGEDVPNGPEKLNELMFSKLSEQDKLFAWAMVDTCDTMYEDTNEVFIRTTGLSLPKVDNYIPSKTERIGSDLDMMHETMLRSTNPSFIKQRKNCSRIKMDPLSPLEIILPHINKTARYVVMSEKVNFYNRIFQSPDIKAKMVEIYGKKSGEKIHRILLNQLATSTYDNYAKSITVGKNLIDNVASNYITSKIGGNLKVMFSQLTSMVNYCENMPFGTWSKGFANALAHPKKTVDFMFKNCEYLQARLAGNSQNEIISMLTNESDKFRALRNFCTSNTKYGDIIAIMFGGKPYVDYLMSQGMSQEEAFTKFTENTLRSQQSGHSSATSAWQKQVAQHAITRMIFAFNNTNFQYERKFVDSMANLAKGDISNEEFMKSFLIYKVFNPILFTSFLSDLSLLMLFQNMFGGGDDDPLTAFGSDIISSILLSNWKAYGILGTLANSIVSLISAEMTGGMYFEDKLPLISDFETSINKLMRGSKLELGDYIEMIAGAGDYGTGIAASRLYNAVGGVGDLMQGNIGTGLLRIGGYGKYKANMAATGQPPEKDK